MTTTPRRTRPFHAFPGMTIEQAVELIHHHGRRWEKAPERGLLKNPHGNGYGRFPLEFTKATARRQLEYHARDCAWCVTHSGTDIRELFDAVQKGTKDPYRYDIGGVLNHAFHGIDGWMA
jgi:broad specificity phosphatase PhoE